MKLTEAQRIDKTSEVTYGARKERRDVVARDPQRSRRLHKICRRRFFPFVSRQILRRTIRIADRGDVKLGPKFSQAPNLTQDKRVIDCRVLAHEVSDSDVLIGLHLFLN